VWQTPLGDIRPDADAETFFAAAADGVYLIKRCDRCNTYLEPALMVCRSCGSSELEWVPSQGVGSLISWTRMHRAYDPYYAGLVPYVLGVFELREGPLAVGRMRSASTVGGLEPGKEFVVAFEPLGDLHVPVFEALD
jgi:uncharacterized OB-fold protein